MTILTAARTLVIGLAVLGAAGPLRAGTIEVLVREAGGGAVPGQTVVLSPATPGERPDNGRGYVHSARLQQTAQDGIARLTAVALGTWRVSVKPTDPAFIDPSDLQGEGVQIVTIAHEEDRLRVELSLARGVRLVLRMSSDRPGKRAGEARLTGARTGAVIKIGLPDGEYAERTVPPDLWTLVAQAPLGWTVIGGERDGSPLPASAAQSSSLRWVGSSTYGTTGSPAGDGAQFELGPDSRPVYLEWRIAAPGRIEGRISAPRPTYGVALHLERLAPGPWAEAQLAQGRDAPEHLVDAPDPRDGTWGIDLPDGVWRVTPELEDTEAIARPPFLDVTVGAEAVARADFEVDLPERKPPSLRVRVEAPDGTLPPGASMVRIVRAGTDEEVERRVGEAVAVFDLPAGSYTITASHPSFLDGTLELPGFEPGNTIVTVTVPLRAGATVRVQAREPDGSAVSGVHVRLEPEDGTSTRAQETDASGWVTFSGLEPGRYRAMAELTEGALRRRAVWENGQRGLEGTEVTVAEHDAIELGLRVVPAATVRGGVVCGDGGALPADAWVAVVPATVEVDDAGAVAASLDVPQLSRVVRLAADGTFEAGPLEAGAVRVALQPFEFDRWTWALGTEDPREGAVVQVEDAEPAELGTVPIVCGPRATLRLDDASPRVNLRAGHAEARGILLEEVDPATGRAGKRTTVVPLAVTRAADSIEVAGLPEGTVELTLILCSPAGPGPKQGENACEPTEGTRAVPVTWAIRVPAVRGKVTESAVVWPWARPAPVVP